MKLSPIVLLFAMIGCGLGTQPAKPIGESGAEQAQRQNVATPDKLVVAPSAEPSALERLVEEPSAQLAVGDPITNSIGMVLVPIPAGEFQMGSPDSDADAADREKPQHLVHITKPFYVSAYEVTQQQYEKVMGVRPWEGWEFVKEGPDFPAVLVGWNDAVEFCEKLSEQEGVKYRLPTEAQWEYACRAGTKTVYSFGDDGSKLGRYGWFHDNTGKIREQYAHRVGQKRPNELGLYDMHGNVWEWCRDRFKNDSSPAVDESQELRGGSRVIRGGSFITPADHCRSAVRHLWVPGYRSVEVGFRMVRTYKAQTSAAKPPDAEAATKNTTAAAETPDAATVKKHMSPVQLALGDPIVNGIGMILAPIPAGEFRMGSPDFDGDAFDNEKPQHLVKFPKPFYLSVFEVTQGQYVRVMEARPWRGKDNVREGPDYPAVYVSWNDAVEFCRKLSETEGVEYRLPTEAEWEYSCRAGTATVYSFGDDESELGEHAWYDKSARDIGEQYAHAVGQKRPNPWGLFDLNGNVFEWCEDVYDQYNREAGNGPSEQATDKNAAVEERVMRGGSFGSDSFYCRAAARRYGNAPGQFSFVGFRVARTFP